jgi:hypothetical protein
LPDANDVIGAADLGPELSDPGVRHEDAGIRRHDDATIRLRVGGPSARQADNGGRREQ